MNPDDRLTGQKGIVASFRALKTQARGDKFVGEFEKRLQRIKEIVCRADALMKTARQALADVGKGKGTGENNPGLCGIVAERGG